MSLIALYTLPIYFVHDIPPHIWTQEILFSYSYSEGSNTPKGRYSECPLFRRFVIPKVRYSEGSIVRK